MFIKFFKELRKNNKKEWFDKNRKRYIKNIKDPFYKFVEDVIVAYDPNLNLTVRESVFRINRDIRFSKDKSPYKTHVGAVIGRGGKQGMERASMYIELSDKDVRLYSGLYMLYTGLYKWFNSCLMVLYGLNMMLLVLYRLLLVVIRFM